MILFYSNQNYINRIKISALFLSLRMIFLFIFCKLINLNNTKHVGELEGII